MSQKSPPPRVSQVLDQTQQAAGHVAAGAQQKVGEVVDGAKQQTTSLLESQKEQAADTLYTLAHALRQTGQQLREQEQAPVAGLADRAAQQAERGSGYLRHHNVSALVNETELLGRTHPLAFTGGALVLGLLGMRFLKSARHAEEPPAPLQLPPASFSSSASTAAPLTSDQEGMDAPYGRGASASASGASEGDAVVPRDSVVIEE